MINRGLSAFSCIKTLGFVGREGFALLFSLLRGQTDYGWGIRDHEKFFFFHIQHYLLLRKGILGFSVAFIGVQGIMNGGYFMERGGNWKVQGRGSKDCLYIETYKGWAYGR